MLITTHRLLASLHPSSTYPTGTLGCWYFLFKTNRWLQHSQLAVLYHPASWVCWSLLSKPTNGSDITTCRSIRRSKSCWLPSFSETNRWFRHNCLPSHPAPLESQTYSHLQQPRITLCHLRPSPAASGHLQSTPIVSRSNLQLSSRFHLCTIISKHLGLAFGHLRSPPVPTYVLWLSPTTIQSLLITWTSLMIASDFPNSNLRYCSHL